MSYIAPHGNIITVLDYVNRDVQDDTFFPYKCTSSWFAPDGTARSIPFSPMLQTFPYKGPATLGQTIIVDIDSRAGDYLHNILLQVQLDDSYQWINNIGYSLIERARIEIGEVTIEEIDTPFSFIALNTLPDTNLSSSISPLLSINDDNRVTCLIPFWFSRIPYKESLPLVACENGTVRIHITFRKLHELVQNGSCNDSNSYPNPSVFRDINIITYSSVISGTLRDQLQTTPFQHIYRPIQSFVVDNPYKYAVTKSNSIIDANDITIPLPFNGPVEEIFWVIRRKSDVDSNKWVEFGRSYQSEPVAHARITINGSSVVSAPGQWFRSHIATLHRGAIAPYNARIYGYSFARTPGEHAPSGAANLSRTNHVDLSLTVRSPGNGDNWEVHVYAIGINWLRFENGMCGRVFST
jgi:hypothetical protein